MLLENTLGIQKNGYWLINSYNGSILDTSFNSIGEIGSGFPPEYDFVLILSDNSLYMVYASSYNKILVLENKPPFDYHSQYKIRTIKYFFIYNNEPYYVAEVLVPKTGTKITLIIKVE
ncbi:MAG: hypothetical protein HOP11_13670 [Saprospiraceae bacterium]|nr:hypothetical protein [Saprospiraceae bacterium]